MGDHVCLTHFAGTLIHETAHSLVNTLENEGYTNEWICVTVRLMMLINIFLTETEHLLCAAIKGENVFNFEETSVVAKDSMSVKAETIKIGGFRVPPTYISEAFSLGEKFKIG